MAAFGAGEIVTADDLNLWVMNCIGGQFRETDATATSGTTEKVYATSNSVNLEGGSLYCARARLSFTSSVANDEFANRIRDTNISGTIVDGIVCRGFGGPGGPYAYYAEYRWEQGSDEAGQVFVATVVRLTGTGTATVQENSYIDIYRIGTTGVMTKV